MLTVSAHLRSPCTSRAGRGAQGSGPPRWEPGAGIDWDGESLAVPELTLAQRVRKLPIGKTSNENDEIRDIKNT